MRRYWNDLKKHGLTAGLFLAYWLIALGLDIFRWRKPENGPDDMVPAVIWLHFLLPIVAGAVVSWWLRRGPGGIAASMVAGAVVLVVDVVVLLSANFVAYHRGESAGGGERITELPVLLIALSLLGSLLGLVGAAGGTGLGLLLGRWRGADVGVASPGDAAGRMPRRLLLAGGGLMLYAAAVVALVVIPAVGTTLSGGAPMGRAAAAFAVNALINLLVGIPLLVPGPRRAAGLSKVLVVLGGLVGLLLGFALLDAAFAFITRGPDMRTAAAACFTSATADLGAGLLVLVAALRRPGKSFGPALPVS